jgi:hypothetical protein
MTTCWSQEEHDASTKAEWEAWQNLSIHPERLIPTPDPRIDRSLVNRAEEEPLLTAGDTQWIARFIGWAIIAAAMTGLVIVFVVDVASLLSWAPP